MATLGTGPGDPGGGSEGRRVIKLTKIDHVRFVVIKAIDIETDISNLTVFEVTKRLENILGIQGPNKPQGARGTNNKNQHQNPQKEIDFVYQKRSKSIKVTAINANQTAKLLKIKKFGNHDVEVFAPIGLNTVRGVVRVGGLCNSSEEEIVESLVDYDVIAARHFTRTSQNGEKTKINTVTLTFQTTKLPQKIKIGYMSVDVSVFVRNPLKCYNCHRFGHLTKYCRNKEQKICANCKGQHETKGCEENVSNYKCVNCPDGSNNHSAISRDCPTFKYQKEICTIMANQNIGFLEAKKQIIAPSVSFANKVKLGTNACTCKCTCQSKNEVAVATPKLPSLEFITPLRLSPNDIGSTVSGGILNSSAYRKGLGSSGAVDDMDIPLTPGNEINNIAATSKRPRSLGEPDINLSPPPKLVKD